MALDPNDIPLTLKKLAERLAELGITGAGEGTLRAMVRDGALRANQDGTTRSTVNLYLAAKKPQTPEATTDAG